jgi:uncharacterized membrane protein YtjA (UPF0391 family)
LHLAGATRSLSLVRDASRRLLKRMNCLCFAPATTVARGVRSIPTDFASNNLAPSGRQDMLHYALVFFVIAIIAAVFGFGGIAAGAVEIAKILFFVFLVIAVITFVMSLLRKR